VARSVWRQAAPACAVGSDARVARSVEFRSGRAHCWWGRASESEKVGHRTHGRRARAGAGTAAHDPRENFPRVRAVDASALLHVTWVPNRSGVILRAADANSANTRLPYLPHTVAQASTEAVQQCTRALLSQTERATPASEGARPEALCRLVRAGLISMGRKRSD